LTRESDKPEIVRRLVVVFDISSSTSILEELKQCDRLAVWRNLLIELKEFLDAHGVELELYKFMGDGWILLFPEDIRKDELFEYLNNVSSFFMYQYQEYVEPLLQKDPRPIGLTLGIDTGELIRLEMNEQIEYLGRTINVAARLQSAAKSMAAEGYTNVALISKASFNSLQPEKSDFKVSEQRVDLKNISGGDKFQCFALYFSHLAES
jgi:class 3 adenylate cyclase